MMNETEHKLYQAVCDRRDRLSERLESMQFSRDLWRGGCLIMAALALLEIVRQWAGWSL